MKYASLFFALDPRRDLIKSFLSFTTTINHFSSISSITVTPLFLTLPIKSQNIHKQNYQAFPKLSGGCRSACNFFFENATHSESRLHTALNNVPLYWNLALGGKARQSQEHAREIVPWGSVSSSFYILLTEVSPCLEIVNKQRKKWGKR